MRENGRENVERPPPRGSIELLSRYGLPKLSSSPESRNRKGNHVGPQNGTMRRRGASRGAGFPPRCGTPVGSVETSRPPHVVLSAYRRLLLA